MLAALPLVLALAAAPQAAPAPLPAASAAPTAVASNLLQNPGFEQGRDGWGIMSGSANWSDFDVVTRLFRSGAHSAYLPVHAGPETKSVRVFGVVQELKNPEFPDTLSGWYHLDTFDRGGPATSLYLQAVVIIWGDPRTNDLVYGSVLPPGAKPITNYQIRYYLTGIDEPPFRLQNARFKFLGNRDVKMGEWVYFEMDLRKDFQELWGVVPQGYQFIRVLFEGRWDNKPAGQGCKIDVCYDDLFVGYGRPPAAARGTMKPVAQPKPAAAVVPKRP